MLTSVLQTLAWDSSILAICNGKHVSKGKWQKKNISTWEQGLSGARICLDLQLFEESNAQNLNIYKISHFPTTKSSTSQFLSESGMNYLRSFQLNQPCGRRAYVQRPRRRNPRPGWWERGSDPAQGNGTCRKWASATSNCKGHEPASKTRKKTPQLIPG